jgi:hypothetical protein
MIEGFLELPTSLYDTELEKMGMPLNYIPGTVFIKISEIAAFATQIGDDNEGNIERVNVFLSSGESFRIEMDMARFKKTLADHK